MKIATELLRIVEQAHSLTRILEASTRLLASRLQVDDCLAFLLDERGDLVRSGAHGARDFGQSPSVEAEARLAAAQATAERRAATIRGRTMSILASPLSQRDTMVGALVLLSRGRREFSKEEIETLAAICGQLVGTIENARIIEALDRGEGPRPRVAPRPPPVAADGETVLRGVGASPGIAIGAAVFRGAYRFDLSGRDLPALDLRAERGRVRRAIEKTRNDLLRIQGAAAREIDEEHALIFASHLLLLNDPMLLERIDGDVLRGTSAPRAIDAALGEFEARLRLVPDSYIQERVDDIDDLRSRLLDHVLDVGSRARSKAHVVISSRIAPSLVVEMKTEGALALVTQSGGATSHGVLLARAMGIPAVTGIADMLTSVRPGDVLVVDGTDGTVVVRPTRSTVRRYERGRRQAERLRTEHARLRDVLAQTADGARVTLYANVSVASDLTIALENGAEGIGLYRTEFPFIIRDALPTVGEQARIYRKAYEVFPDGPIHFRILDLAGDKFMAGRAIAAARSAFHGYRSIRVLFDHPEVLRDQVQAFALAARERPLGILIPMVTSLEDLRRVKTMVAEALAGVAGAETRGTLGIGAMIEVPAAVELAADIAREVDFLSIGTNDLMQYALVMDREDSRMAQMSDPYHPAILRMIARVTSAARAAGKPVGVCGEIAVRPDLALALIALGVDSLSVVPTAIPRLKQALSCARLAPMRDAIAGILSLSDARSVAAALRGAQTG